MTRQVLGPRGSGRVVSVLTEFERVAAEPNQPAAAPLFYLRQIGGSHYEPTFNAGRKPI